ncbi:hypothetical protein B0O99DRAFT_63966 [Bisporella sp. PMI_857]|nr:hypothetical protein B0O99DRAFT_63966 [Bisporella sp. PMI_857]
MASGKSSRDNHDVEEFDIGLAISLSFRWLARMVNEGEMILAQHYTSRSTRSDRRQYRRSYWLGTRRLNNISVPSGPCGLKSTCQNVILCKLFHAYSDLTIALSDGSYLSELKLLSKPFPFTNKNEKDGSAIIRWYLFIGRRLGAHGRCILSWLLGGC